MRQSFACAVVATALLMQAMPTAHAARSEAVAPHGAQAPAQAAQPPAKLSAPTMPLPGQVERVVLTAGTIDRAADGLRHHPHRRHQSGGRRRGRRPAREILIDGKTPGTISLIVWGGDRASTTTWSSNRRHDAPAAAAGALPGRGHQRQRDRRGDHALGRRLEQRRHAAGRRNRAGEFAEGQGHQHAAAARRSGEPAGHAAGAVRRGEPAGADRARLSTSSSTRPDFLGRSTTQQFAAPTIRRSEAASDKRSSAIS